MQRVTRWKMVFSACLAAVLLAGPAQAEDKKLAAKALDRHTLDESIYQNLRGIIDHGADLYNQGDWNGCYRLWEGALISLKPLLDHRPKLRQAIDGGLTSAAQDAMLWHRAWVLREVLDKIRSDIDADYPHRKKSKEGKPAPKTPVVTPKPEPKPEPEAAIMWDRLGGEPGVTRIVDDFVNLSTRDPKVDFFRHNKVKLDAEHVVKMKRELVQQISQLTGGPLKYTGPDMKKIHKDMGITNEQFDASVANLKKVLEKHKVGPEDRKKILAAVESSRKEIVQPKKPEEKKPVQKKPDVKKPEEKKPIEKKPPEEKDGKEAAGKAHIDGKVSYQGKPQTGGIISFEGINGAVFSAVIAADSTYVVNRVKPGEYKVAINTKANPKIPQVPAKYSDPDKSGLTYTVTEGKQTFDIELK
ncbi:MAG TPA: hypothetical protein VMG10_16865 [Gemmataceae bacterium]|nr:hypothetical protein [Gemmataceae bacterium]